MNCIPPILAKLFCAAIFQLLIFAASPAAAQADTHGLTWAQCQQLNGKYPGDAAADKILSVPLKALLKKKYKEFDTNFTVQTPMEIAEGVLLSSGMRPQSGGDFASFAYFAKSGKLLVVIKRKKKLEYIGDKSLSTIPAVAKHLKQFS